MSDWASIRGNADALPTDPRNQRFRPGSVTTVAALVYLSAAWEAFIGILAITVAISSSQAERFFKGQYLGTVSDGYLWFYGLTGIALAFLLVWVAKTLLVGDPNARFIVIVLAALNIVFALFSFPWGMVGLVLNLLVIALLCTAKARRWFDESGFVASRPNAFS